MTTYCYYYYVAIETLWLPATATTVTSVTTSVTTYRYHCFCGQVAIVTLWSLSAGGLTVATLVTEVRKRGVLVRWASSR